MKKKIHPVKYHRVVISRKAKLFNRVKKIHRVKSHHLSRIKSRRRVRIFKRARKIHPVKSRKAGISRKTKLFNRARKKVVVKPQQDISLSSKAIFKPKIRVIGIGGGGGGIVSEIGKFLERASFVVADTDIRSIKKKAGIKYFYFGESLTKGLGTGMDPELAKEVAEKEKERISGLIRGQDIIILVASLGGGVGSGATPFFAQLARNLRIPTLGIFTTPFKFEGKKKAKISSRALKKLKEHLNAIITISNDRIFKIIDEKTSITEAFSLVNKRLVDLLESLIELIYNPGLINIDFADVRTILRGRGMTAFLNSVEFCGKARAEETAKKIFSNFLFKCNIKAKKILFNISGGKNLGMFEVGKISQAIANLNPKAKIIFGISKSQKLKNKIKTTVFATGFSIAYLKTEIRKKIPKPLTGRGPGVKRLRGEKNKKLLKKSGKKRKKKIVHKKEKRKKKIFSRPGKISIPITMESLSKKTINKKEILRRNALEIKKAQEMEEHKRLSEESQWEIPAFLRRAKFKT